MLTLAFAIDQHIIDKAQHSIQVIQQYINRFWNSSGAHVIPKGSTLNWYLPKGVMNVVSGHDSGASGVCQNPKFASNLVNIFAPES